METDAAIELLNEGKSRYLKEYNRQKINNLIEKTDYIKNEMKKIRETATGTEITDEISKNYIFLKSTYDFYIRVKRSYELSRFLKIQQNCFEKKSEMANLTKKETEHVAFFEEILEEYTNDFPECDFAVKYVPLNHFVHFITLADCGIVMDGDEMYELKANRYYYMKKSVIKHLLDSNLIKIV